MSKTGVSIVVYSIYLGSLGLGMALIPNVLFRLFNQPTTQEVWIGILGFLALLLSVKGIYGAILNIVPMMQLDVITRISGRDLHHRPRRGGPRPPHPAHPRRHRLRRRGVDAGDPRRGQAQGAPHHGFISTSLNREMFSVGRRIVMR